MFSKTASNPATFTIKKTTSHYTYSHQKYWIVDDKSVGLSTGNMSPSDFNNQTASTDKVRSFPPFGVPGWTRLNRDLTICTESFPYCLPVPLHFRPQYSFAYHSLTIRLVFTSDDGNPLGDAFRAMFEGDLDERGTFPHPVYPWTPKYQVYCGDGRRL